MNLIQPWLSPLPLRCIGKPHRLVKPKKQPAKVPPTEPPNTKRLWFAGHLREDLLQLKKGDLVYTRPFNAKLAAGPCWWVMSTKKGHVYKVAESWVGANCGQLVSYITQDHKMVTSPPDQVALLEHYLRGMCKQSTNSKVPLDAPLVKGSK